MCYVIGNEISRHGARTFSFCMKLLVHFLFVFVTTVSLSFCLLFELSIRAPPTHAQPVAFFRADI